jgi:hypothetical protein
MVVSQSAKAVKHITSEQYFSMEEKNSFKEAKRRVRERASRNQSFLVSL